MTTHQGNPREILKQLGIQYTCQREIILQVILEGSGHLDAYDIYEIARGNTQKISLSTVYRILQVFRDNGLVSENHLGEEHHHYEVVRDGHHHAVCEKCGTVIEFSLSKDKILGLIPEVESFAPSLMEISMIGVCAKCRNGGNDND
ncbi:MAG: transcriptional repressor [Spirochaetales bacterium]|nr:transcriptional repressor [Spirochaetales bacterium]